MFFSRIVPKKDRKERVLEKKVNDTNIIFDMTRGDRRYDDDTDISDYKVKILLKTVF